MIWSSMVSNEVSCWRKLPHTWQTNWGMTALVDGLLLAIVSERDRRCERNESSCWLPFFPLLLFLSSSSSGACDSSMRSDWLVKEQLGSEWDRCSPESSIHSLVWIRSRSIWEKRPNHFDKTTATESSNDNKKKKRKKKIESFSYKSKCHRASEIELSPRVHLGSGRNGIFVSSSQHACSAQRGSIAAVRRNRSSFSGPLLMRLHWSSLLA